MPVEYKITVRHINIGVGDCELIIWYNTNSTDKDSIIKAILIDGGKNYPYVINKILQVLKKHLHYEGAGYRHLDAIVVSHYDFDHYGGILGLLKEKTFRDNFLNNTYLYDSGAKELVKKENVKSLNDYFETIEEIAKIDPQKLIRLTGEMKNQSSKGLLLGYDLFRNPPFTLVQLTFSDNFTVSNLRTLNGHKPEDPRPALFCVSVNEVTLGDSLTLLPHNNTLTNNSSIALVLFDQKDRMVHYLGGDLTDDYEKKVAAWIGTIGTPNYRIPFAKASHHLSIGSTPPELLKALNPEKLIVSAGGQHKHPNAQVLIYLDYYNRWLSKKNLKPIQIRAMACPYYLKNEFILDKNKYFNEHETIDSLKDLITENLGQDEAESFFYRWESYEANTLNRNLLRIFWEDLGFPSYESTFEKKVEEVKDLHRKTLILLNDKRLPGWINFILKRIDIWCWKVQEYDFSINPDSNVDYVKQLFKTLKLLPRNFNPPIDHDILIQYLELVKLPLVKLSRKMEEQQQLWKNKASYFPPYLNSAVYDKPKRNSFYPSKEVIYFEVNCELTKSSSQYYVFDLPDNLYKWLKIESQPFSLSSKKATLSSTDASTVAIYSHDGSSSTGYILTSDCTLDAFVGALVDKQLILISATASTSGSIVTLEGTLDAHLSNWLWKFGLDTLKIKLTGTLEGHNTLAVDIANVAFNAQIAAGQLVDDGVISLVGSLQTANELCFKFDSSVPKINIGKCATFINFFKNSESNTLLDILEQIGGDSLLFPLLVEQSQLRFNPLANYLTQQTLVSDLGSFTQLTPLVLTNIQWGFSNSSLPIYRQTELGAQNPTPFIQQTLKAFFSASLTITTPTFSLPQLTILASLNDEGAGSFAVDLPSTVSMLDDLVQAFSYDTELSTRLITNLKALKIDFNFVKSLIIDFNLPKTISRIQLISQLDFNLFEPGISLTLAISLPDLSIVGTLSTDPDLTARTTVTSLVFNRLLQPYRDNLKGLDTLLNDLLTFELADLNFYVAPTYHHYSLSANLINDNMNNSWSFTPEIVFEQINITLNYDGASTPAAVSASLSGIIELDGDQEEFSVDYSSITSSWRISSMISYLNLTKLLALLPVVPNSVLTSLPALLIQNVAIDFTLDRDDSHNLIRNFTLLGAMQIKHAIVEAQATINSTLDKEGKRLEQNTLLSLMWSDKDYPLTLQDIIQATGLMFTLPAEIDLAFTGIGFTYSATTDNTAQPPRPTSQNQILIDLTTQYDGAAAVVLFNLVTTTTTLTAQVLTAEYSLPSTISNLPLISSLPMPLQKLQLIWLSHDLGINDIDQVNALIQSNTALQTLLLPDALVIDKVAPQGASLAITIAGIPKPYVIGLTTHNNKGPSNSPQPAFKETSQKGLKDVTLSPPPSSDSPVAWLNVQKTLGPLSVQRIGLRYQSQKLWLMFDAQLALGGLSVGTQGLGFGFSLTELANAKLNLDTFVPSAIQLNGLFVGLSTDAFTLSGSFLHDNPALPNASESYNGTVTIAADGFNLGALGAYAKLQDNGNPSFFVFLEVNSAEGFGGPPCFFIKGFSGGFGYNWSLRLPTPDQVFSFPFLQGLSGATSSPDLSTALTNLLQSSPPWLTPSLNQDWLALGINFTSFELVNSQALLIAQFGSSFKLALVGKSWMQLPTPIPNTPTIAYVEMDLAAVFAPTDGTFTLSAVLSPNSYVLDPNCHLTGGFAMGNWFGNNAHAGDFVVTLGGYNSQFKVPSWYPTVPRLGLNWQVDSNLSFSGSVYCAITPSCIMAGTAVTASYQSGNLKANFNAMTDFIVDWKPFAYQATINIGLNVAYKLNLLFTTKTLSLEISAGLNLWGPPLGGSAYLDLHIAHFTLNFGTAQQPLPPASWHDFKTLLPSSASVSLTRPTQPQAVMSLSGNPSSPVAACKVQLVSGLLSSSATGTNGTWAVRADEFSFQVNSVLPLNQVVFMQADSMTPNNTFALPVTDATNALASAINIKPMQLQNLTSCQHITITSLDNRLPQPLLWAATLQTNSLPNALWGTPGITGQPPALNSTSLVSNLAVGLLVTAPVSQPGGTPLTLPVQNLGADTAIGPPSPLPLSITAEADRVHLPNPAAVVRPGNAKTLSGNSNATMARYLTARGLFNAKPSAATLAIAPSRSQAIALTL